MSEITTKDRFPGEPEHEIVPIVRVSATDAILHSFYDSAPMMMGVVEVLDNDILHLSDNAATAQFMGMAAGATAGRRASELGMPWEHIQEWIRHYRAAERTRTPVRFEYQHQTQHGARWMSAIVSFIGGTDAGHVRCSYIVEDITAQKQALLNQQFVSSLDEKIRALTAPEEILWTVAQATGQHLGVSRAHFNEVDVDADQISVHRNYTHDTFSSEGSYLLSSFGSPELLAGLHAGQVLAIADVIADTRTAAAYETAYRPLNVRAFVAVPCMRAGQWVGTFLVDSRTPRCWTVEEISLLETVAQRTWLAAENGRLYEVAERDALLLRTVRDSIIVTDLEGIVTYWNEGATRLFGWEAAEMIGKPYADRFSEPTRTRISDSIRARAEGIEWSGEFEDIHKDGSRLWIDARVRRIYDYRGQPIGIMGISHDITARKIAEIQQQFLAEASDLLASSLDYQTTLQSVAQLVVPHLADWCVVHLLNEAAALELVTVAHVDPAKGEVARESSRRYPPRMDVPRGPAAVLRSGKAEWLEDISEDMIRAAAQDEEHFQLLSTSGMKSYLCVPLIARGKTLGTLTFVGAESGHRYTAESLPLAEDLARRAAIAVDNARLYAAAQKEIAERHQAEAALQESRDYYRTLTEALPQLVWTTGQDGVPDYFNQNWLDYTGQIPHDKTTWWKGSIHPDDLPNVMERWITAVRIGEPYEVEYRLRRADGEYRWFLARGVPLKNQQGEILRWFGTCTDIDEQKRAEIEIAALNARLRRSVQETHHRVKNNLQIISALVEVQVEEGSNTVPATALARIGQHTRALAAVHDLLTHEAKADVHTDSISTKGALDKLIPLLQATTGGRRIEYQADDFHLPVREGASLALLISELVSNAVKHGRGDIEVTLKAEGNMAHLEICDDGPGFPATFNPRTAANTGLGLIDSTGRYDLLGMISYENREEGGARVVVTFPMPQT